MRAKRLDLRSRGHIAKAANAGADWDLPEPLHVLVGRAEHVEVCAFSPLLRGNMAPDSDLTRAIAHRRDLQLAAEYTCSRARGVEEPGSLDPPAGGGFDGEDSAIARVEGDCLFVDRLCACPCENLRQRRMNVIAVQVHRTNFDVEW